jgi:uncharacterized protein (UPF0548 family)
LAEWRLFRGWTVEEIAERLANIGSRPKNFRSEYSAMTAANGWNQYHSEAVIAREPLGPPLESGPFRRAEVALANYQFSNPRIVVAHFEAASRLLGRRMLLEMKALRSIHYLAAVVIDAVRFDEQDDTHTFGYRYDTLDGHIERGAEWFLLTKRASTGEVCFRIEAAWRPGQFPNWWSREGFRWLGTYYQKRWHHDAHWRLWRIAHGGMSASPPVDDKGVAHAGPAIVFQRTPRNRTLQGPRWEEEEETIQST